MNISYSFELLGTFFFAISGALVLKDKDHDWLGAGITGFLTAIGGGSVRDILLGSYPLVWVKDPLVLYAIFAGLVVTSIAHESLGKLKKTMRLFDTLGIGFFTILGTKKP